MSIQDHMKCAHPSLHEVREFNSISYTEVRFGFDCPRQVHSALFNASQKKAYPVCRLCAGDFIFPRTYVVMSLEEAVVQEVMES